MLEEPSTNVTSATSSSGADRNSISRRNRENRLRAERARHKIKSLIDGDYRAKPRTFASIAPFLGTMYASVDTGSGDAAYDGFESPTRPNVTALYAWPNGEKVDYGSTLGHFQYDPAEQPNKILEVYEVISGYGVMILDRPDEPYLDAILLRPGDKVGTPNNCVMTIIALGSESFETLDFANPARHIADKRLQETEGPCLAIREQDGHVCIDLNPNYVDRDDGFGVVSPETTEPIRLPLNGHDSADVYQLLCSPEAVTEFRRRGIRLRTPSNDWLAEQTVIPVDALRTPLSELRKDTPDHPLQRYMFGAEQPNLGLIAVVGGGGEIVTNRLEPAIARLGGEPRFVCIDTRSADACGAVSHAFHHWLVPTSTGATLAKLAAGGYSAIHLSTPPSVTGRLLLGMAGMVDLSVPVVTAEKPWFQSIDEAREFAGRVAESSVEFRFWDHYLARPAIAWLLAQDLGDLIGGAAMSVEFQLHEASAFTSAAQVEAGILADLAIHACSVVRALWPGCEFIVTSADAVKLAGTPGERETFVLFAMEGRDAGGRAGVTPTIRISAGKYVPREMARKTMTIHGPSGRLEVNLAADTIDCVVDGERRQLFPPADSTGAARDAYETLACGLADGTAHELGLAIDDVLAIWSWLATARGRFARPLIERAETDYLKGLVSE